MKKLVTWFSFLFFMLGLLVMSPSESAADIVTVPADVTEIEEEAFAGDYSVTEVYLPDGIVSIGSRAFADTGLTQIYLPGSLTDIAEDAFDGCGYVTAWGPAGTDAAAFCDAHGIPYEVIGGAFSIIGPSVYTYDEWNRYSLQEVFLTLEGVPASASVQWMSSDPEIAVVTGNGEVRFCGKEGVVTITASAGGAQAVHDIAVTVVQEESTLGMIDRETLRLSSNGELEIALGESYSLNLRDGDSIRTDIAVWQSSNEDAAVIIPQFDNWHEVYIQAVSVGASVITVSCAGKTDTLHVRVVYPVDKELGFEPPAEEQVVPLGGTARLLINPKGYTYYAPYNTFVANNISWTSSDESIVRVYGKSYDARAFGIKEGYAEITAAFAPATHVPDPPVEVTFPVYVSASERKPLSFSAATQIYAGDLVPAGVSGGFPELGYEVVSSDESVISVVMQPSGGSEYPFLSAHKPGSAVVTVHNGPYAKTMRVEVLPASSTETGMYMRILNDFIFPGRTASLAGFNLPENVNGQPVWKSSNPSVLSVKNTSYAAGDPFCTAELQAGQAGSAVISLTVNGKTVSTEAVITTFPSVNISALSTNSRKLYVGYSRQLTAFGVGDGETVFWETSDESIATVTSSGTVTAQGAGYVTITARTADGASDSIRIYTEQLVEEYFPMSITCTDYVNTPGSTGQIMAHHYQGSYDDIQYWSGDPEIASVDGNGAVTFLKPGYVTLYAILGDQYAYCGAIVVDTSDLPMVLAQEKETDFETIYSTLKEIAVYEGETIHGIVLRNAKGTQQNWVIADPTVAAVTGNDGIHPEVGITGLSEGTTTLTVTSGGESTELRIRVFPK